MFFPTSRHASPWRQFKKEKNEFANFQLKNVAMLIQKSYHKYMYACIHVCLLLMNVACICLLLMNVNFLESAQFSLRTRVDFYLWIHHCQPCNFIMVLGILSGFPLLMYNQVLYFYRCSQTIVRGWQRWPDTNEKFSGLPTPKKKIKFSFPTIFYMKNIHQPNRKSCKAKLYKTRKIRCFRSPFLHQHSPFKCLWTVPKNSRIFFQYTINQQYHNCLAWTWT